MLRVIEADLRTLSMEARRRFPEVKEAAEQGLQRLRIAQDELPAEADAAAQVTAVAASEELLLPFTLALACKSDALPLCALSAVQRMISHGAVAPAHLPAIASQLIARAQQPCTDEMLLKVLQTVLTIASSPALLLTDVVVSQLLLLCLTLLSSKSATIRRTASATSQQFVALLLDLAAAEMTSGRSAGASGRPAAGSGDLAHLSVVARCAYLSVLDLCMLASGEGTQWLTGLSAPVPDSFALEVVQRSLASSHALFLQQPDFRHLLREHACPLALKCMQHAAQHHAVTDWDKVLRACHLTSTLLAGYAKAIRTETEILLVTLGKMLEAESTPVWQRALVLETFRVIGADAPLLTSIFTTYDLSPSASNALATLVTATAKLIASPAVDFAAHAEFIEILFVRVNRSASATKPACFNQSLYSESDGSHVSHPYAAALAVECVLSLIASIVALSERAARRADASHSDSAAAAPNVVIGGVTLSVSEAARGETQLVRSLVVTCCTPLLASLALATARFTTDEAVQAMLKAFQAFTHACGRLSLHQPRDALLTALCQYALPPRARRDLREARGALSFAPADTTYEPLPHTALSAKNVLALKALFNIAHCMGTLLGSGWDIVLQAFEQLDRIISASKLTPPHEPDRAVALGSADGTANELGILNTALHTLFTTVSVSLDDEAIGDFLTALSTQCLASLAFEATSKEKAATPGSAMPPRLFALTRFVDTTLANMQRAPTLWPLVSQFLLPVANHKVPRIRVVGMESLSLVVLAAMKYGRSTAAAQDDAAGRRDPATGAAGGWGELGGWGGAWDRHALAPLEELQRRCSHRETQERVLQCVHQLLRSDGSSLVEGWLLILSILYRAATRPVLLPLLPLAIRSVQLIASDLLPCLPPPCLLAYVEVAAAYATQPGHLNASLTAVGLQWTISDFLHEYAAGEEAEAELPADDDGDEPADGDDRRFSSASERGSGRQSNGGGDSDEAGGEEESAHGSALAPAPRYAALRVDEPVSSHELWCAIARQLRRLSADERSEVRTCSLHTLASVLTSNGSRLSGRTWDYALFHALLPMMREVSAAAASASTTQPVAKPLGREGGVPVLMLLHHSRDTASKQWDETWVLLLRSSARLIRGFLPTLRQRPHFDQAWGQLLAFGHASLLSAPRSGEVAKAAIGALMHELLFAAVSQKPTPCPADPASPADEAVHRVAAAHTTPLRPGGGVPPATPVAYERLPPALWTSVWELLEKATAEMTADADAYAVHAEVLTALLDSTRELYVQARTQFDEADVLRLLTLCTRLATPPGTPVGWDPYLPPAKPSALQLSALKLLEALPPFPPNVRADALHPLLLLHLLKFVSIARTSPAGDAAPATKPASNGIGFSEEAYGLLLRMLVSDDAPAAQLEVLEDVLQVLRSILQLSRDPAVQCPSLPREVARSFVGLTRAIIPALAAASSDSPVTAASGGAPVWASAAQDELIGAMRALLSTGLAAPGEAAPPPRDISGGEAAGGPARLLQLAESPSADELAQELSVLLAARQMLRAIPGLSDGARRELLGMMRAVVALPAAAALRHGDCWSEALDALCEAAGGFAGGRATERAGAGAAPASTHQPVVSPVSSPTSAGLAVTPRGTAEGAAQTAELALPLLVEAVRAALAEWAAQDGDGEWEAMRPPRAEQLSAMLSRVSAVRLRQRPRHAALPEPSTAGAGALVAARQSPFGHLVTLAPALINAIGRPAHTDKGPAPGREAHLLQSAIREALQLVASTLNL